MKNLILSTAVLMFVGLTAFAQNDVSKDKKNSDKKCEMKSDCKTGKCDKTCEMKGGCKAEKCDKTCEIKCASAEASAKKPATR